MNQLLSLSYYFSIRPNSNFQFSKLTLLACVLVVIAGVLVLIYRKKKAEAKNKKWMQTYGKRLINMGIFALFLLFVREVGIPYFSMRLWWVLWLVLMIVFSAMAFKNFIKVQKNTVSTGPKKEDPRAKYLPKKKRK